ncbi:hypothetical protein EYR36_004058 [Pleurotus pulmonarius]|nr:hypothetical protein EYR36_004058 [Pleurotus pulmonarius]
MSRRRSRKADSDDEDEEDFSELMERCSSPPPYPPSKRPCHRAGTASISSTAEPQSPTLPSQSLSAATSLNPNMALTTRQIAHHHRLKVAQVPELERFSLDPPNIMLMKVYAKLTALENKMASIEAAVPEYSVSASLKVNIDKYAAAVLLSTKIIAYKGDPPTEQLLSIIRKFQFDLPVGIERNPADWAKIANSVKLPGTDTYLAGKECQDIYTLTKSLVAGTSCKISSPLCARVAVLRKVYIVNPGSSFWDKVDSKLRSIRKQADFSEEMIQKILKGTLSADKKQYGDVEGIIQEQEPAAMVNQFQQTVDEIIELNSLTPAGRPNSTASRSPEPRASANTNDPQADAAGQITDRPMGSAHSKNATVDEDDKIALRLANYAATTASSNGKNVLARVEQATLLAHEPHLQEAATLAVALLDMIPRLCGNESAFRSLATDACDLVYAVMNGYEECDKQGCTFPQGMVHILQVSLQQIKQEVESVASRGFLSGFLSRGDDAERIKKCKEDSQRYLDMLELQSHITTRQAVSHIQEQTNTILAASQSEREHGFATRS